MKLVMRENGFCEGVALSELDKTEIKETKDEIREVFIKFLKGKAEWWMLCETLCSYEDREEFTIGIFAHLLTWVEDKGII